ncbi:hypothetical protein [Paludisphaera mucosa]|uniref:Uncharacterized protein n=1 Tax=Paludisphaera mucosa TaxID=3030827 RepID=A0ABT6F580_9BACT|nr:hypothetical protein [Paludisphaera mucosa]MDG3002736.1 hypothetical protein [Paludisphaera mucosa]
MTPRRAETSLFALRLGAFLAAWVLALASPSNALAGCTGLAHRSGDDHRTGPLGLSAELIADAGSPDSSGDTPLKPGGCTGAFCSKPVDLPGMDFSGGVDLRVELWADSLDPAVLRGPGRSRPIQGGDDLAPILRRDFIFHPPR